MARPAILQPGQSYTFRQYFEMAYEPEDILAEFGYSFKRSPHSPHSSPLQNVEFQLAAFQPITPHQDVIERIGVGQEKCHQVVGQRRVVA